MLKSLFILNEDAYSRVYDLVHPEIDQLVDIIAPPFTSNDLSNYPDELCEVEVLITGWGAPLLDAEFLAAAPNLKLVLYGAGSVKKVVTDAFWASGIPITNAANGNGNAVADYTVGAILMALKGGWHYARSLREDKYWHNQRRNFPGTYETVVGIVSLGMIGRRVCELLRHFEMKVIAYDPFADQQTASDLGVELVDLETLFKSSHVVSLHTPWLPETVNMITGDLIALMPEYGALINTARGAVIDEAAMIEVLKKRPDLYAILDVTYPEPPADDSLLYTLKNVVLMPHIAGVISPLEGRRMGREMIEELKRFIAGDTLQWQIHQSMLKTMA